MKNTSDYFFLEKVPSGHLMDVVYINLGHTMMAKRPEFGITESIPMALIFENGSYKIFLETKALHDAGQAVMDYMLESDERVDAWEKRMYAWLHNVVGINDMYRQSDFSGYTPHSLAHMLDMAISYELLQGYESMDIVPNNYGTNLIHKALEKTLKEIGFAPHAIAPILLRAEEPIEFVKYERALATLALQAHQKGITELTEAIVSEHIDVAESLNQIKAKYDWLDASLADAPKTREAILKDINALLSFGAELPRILASRGKEDEEKRQEREEVFEGVIAKADDSQKRVISFACKSVEIGNIFVDRIMEFIYLRRAIYKEWGKRIGLSEEDTKYLLPEELKDCLLNNVSPDTELIAKRRALCVAVIENDSFVLHVGEEAKKLASAFDRLITDDVSPLQGEVAYSGGKIEGIARMVTDVNDMERLKEGEILVSSRTYPDLLPAMKRSKAIVAELGGLLSHAAIVSREMKIPCLVGVRNATTKIKDGQRIEVDTEAGAITLLD